MEKPEKLENNSSWTKLRRQQRVDTRACVQGLESEPHGSVRSLAICLPSDYSIVSFYSGFDTTAYELLSPSFNRVAGGTKITHRCPILCCPPECMPISSTYLWRGLRVTRTGRIFQHVPAGLALAPGSSSPAMIDSPTQRTSSPFRSAVTWISLSPLLWTSAVWIILDLGFGET